MLSIIVTSIMNVTSYNSNTAIESSIGVLQVPIALWVATHFATRRLCNLPYMVGIFWHKPHEYHSISHWGFWEAITWINLVKNYSSKDFIWRLYVWSSYLIWWDPASIKIQSLKITTCLMPYRSLIEAQFYVHLN